MNEASGTERRHIDNFFSTPAAREDRWRDLLDAARARAAGTRDRAGFETALNETAAIEEFHGYDPKSVKASERQQAELGNNPSDEALLNTWLIPDPAKVRQRVYQTNSTHKSMSALRQGSMILVKDVDYHTVEEQFHEAVFTHASTSPNQQLIGSLDVTRRQMELEGYGLVMNAINNTRSDVAHLIRVLVDISRAVDRRLEQGGEGERQAFWSRVKSLMTDVPDLPNFSCFHDAFRSDAGARTSEGDIRSGFYAAYDAAGCEHIRLADKEIDRRLQDGPSLVSANFVIPYPPGFPIMVPGQVLSHDTIDFMRKRDVKEIHGYDAAEGLKLIRPGALEKRAGAAHAADSRNAADRN